MPKTLVLNNQVNPRAQLLRAILKVFVAIVLIGQASNSWSQGQAREELGLGLKYDCTMVSDDQILRKIVVDALRIKVPSWFEQKFPIGQTRCTVMTHHISGMNGGAGFCFSIVQVSLLNPVTNVSVNPFTWRATNNAQPYPSCIDSTMGEYVANKTLSDARAQ